MRYIALPILALACTLTACGGGGGGDATGGGDTTPRPPAPATSPMSGAWQGTDPDGGTLNALVLDDGTLWLVGVLNGIPVVQVRASTQASAGRFQTSDVRYVDYRASQPSFTFTGSLQGSYVEGGSILATLSDRGEPSRTYTLKPMPTETLNYGRAASLGDVAGAWKAPDTQITVRADGSFETLGRNGCRNTGTLKPHASKKNVFDLGVTYGAAPCAYPGQHLAGVAVVTAQQTLLATALNDGVSLTLPATRQP